MVFTDDEYKKIDSYIQTNKQMLFQSDWKSINNEKILHFCLLKRR